MANDKRPPIRFDGNISKQELGQIKPPSKAEMQSRLQAADQTPKERQASAARVEQVTNRAMAYVQAQKQDIPGRTTQAASRPTETPGLANDARQRESLRAVSRDQAKEQSQQKEKNHER